MSGFDTLPGAWMVWDGPAPAPGGAVLEQTRELDKFLGEIERRAFRMAQVALRDPDDAMDAVQDAMLKLARNYGARPSAEWRPLFYRILENAIRDQQRRRSVRKRFMVWLPGPKEDPDNEAQDPLDSVADGGPQVPEQLMQAQAMQKLESSLRELPSSKTYQLWGLARGNIVSLGLVGPDPHSVAPFRIEAGITTVMVTAEPSGGTPKPTLPVVAQGTVPPVTVD